MRGTETSASEEWSEGGPFIFFVWNEKTNRIESHGLYTLAGRADVYAVTCREDGSFELSPTHETLTPCCRRM